MDLVNDLSSDVALAVLLEGNLRQKLDARDAKSFIALVESELMRIESREVNQAPASAMRDLTH